MDGDSVNYIDITIVLIFGLIVFLVLFIFSFVNRLEFYKHKVIDKFSGIKIMIEERVEIIDTLYKYIRDNCPHEDNLIRELENLTTSFRNTDKINELLVLISKSRDILHDATKLDNTYDYLKDSKEYLGFKNMIKDNDGKLLFASSVYNEKVSDYNNFKNNKYISILSKIFRFPSYNYYE